MPRIVLTAQVEDPSTWEQKYRTHRDLMELGNLGSVHYTVTDDGIVMYMKVDELDAYMEFMGSKAVADAMKEDGVKRETVKVHVLDKEFSG
ncbi:MAG TPA: hypothetical protein VMO47_05415 [Rhodothermales bacterium]|nr:hypothetical protein [Rhodothermales bacterium]